MEQENLKEYELIRGELLILKDCITKFMGIVLGGSGAIFFGLARFSSGDSNYLPLAYATLSLSMAVSLVLLLLFYKFNSHNRYAGYCKLLNQEQFSPPDRRGGKRNLLAWEICLDGLRASEVNASIAFAHCKGMNISRIDGEAANKETDQNNLDENGIHDILNKYYGPGATADKSKFRKGFALIFRFIGGNLKSRSWGYPLYIVLVFAALLSIYLIVGIYFTYHLAIGIYSKPLAASASGTAAYSDIEVGFLTISALLVLLLQGWMWKGFLEKLHMLIDGSNTVDAYCWKFLPFRYHFVKEVDRNIGYHLTTIRDFD